MKNNKKILIGVISVIFVIALCFFLVRANKARKTQHLSQDEFKVEYSSK